MGGKEEGEKDNRTRVIRADKDKREGKPKGQSKQVHTKQLKRPFPFDKVV